MNRPKNALTLIPFLSRNLCGFFLLTFASTPLLAENTEVTDQDLVSQWLKTERLITQEATDWQAEQEHTSQLLKIYQEELALLNEELAKAGNNASLIDEEAEELKEKITSSEAARRNTISYLIKVKPRVQQLFQQFPRPLQDQLQDESLALDEDVTNRNSGEIFRSIINILQEAARFNRSFTFEEQEIKLSGKDYRAKVIYFGLSQAFFLAGDKAGISKPAPGGWSFTERAELAPELKKAFAIQAKEVPSAYFSIPLKK